MVTVFIRTLLIYILLSAILRLMGKRQIGEIDLSELISTLILSQIATMPIEDPDIPLLFALVPILLIPAVELFTSDIKNRLPFLKRIFEGRPSVLVRRGALDQSEMKRMRISVEELYTAFRLQGVTDLAEVAYAILEPNGQLSVIPKRKEQPPTAADLSLSVTERGISHPIIVDGEIDLAALREVGRSEEWLSLLCRANDCRTDEVFLLSVDDNGSITLVPKAKADRPPRTRIIKGRESEK